jgi:conjugal transfer pilus assembly protein TraL
MEDPNLFYAIPKHLNKGKTLVGLPQTEVLPAFILCTVLFMAKHQLIGLIVGISWFMGLRIIKTKYGNNIIPLALYWFGSESVNQPLFKHTPPANKRYWIF